MKNQLGSVYVIVLPLRELRVNVYNYCRPCNASMQLCYMNHHEMFALPQTGQKVWTDLQKRVRVIEKYFSY